MGKFYGWLRDPPTRKSFSTFKSASISSTYTRPSVRLSHFRISVVSASLRPYKASRQHCGDRHGGWDGGRHEGGHGGWHQHRHRHQHGNQIWWECWLRGLVNQTQIFSTRTYPACASSIMLCQFISKVGASKKRKFPFGRFLVRAEC